VILKNHFIPDILLSSESASERILKICKFVTKLLNKLDDILLHQCCKRPERKQEKCLEDCGSDTDLVLLLISYLCCFCVYVSTVIS